MHDVRFCPTYIANAVHRRYRDFGPIRHIELKRVQVPPLFGFVEFEDDRDAVDAVRAYVRALL
jgi:hypothetical protein